MTCCGSTQASAAYTQIDQSRGGAPAGGAGDTNAPSPVPNQGREAAAGGAEAITPAPQVPDTRYDAAWQEDDAGNGDPARRLEGAAATGGRGEGGAARASAWNGRWERRFTDLRLAPADMEVLRNGTYTEAELEEFARRLEGMPLLDPATGQEIAPGAGSSPAGTPGAAGAGGWNADWQRRFSELLPASEVKAIRDAGLTGQELATYHQVVREAVTGVPADLDAAGIPGGGSTPSGAGSNLPAGPGTGPAMQNAWGPQWQRRFTDLFRSMGMNDAQIREQFAALEGQPVSEEQLQAVYDDLKASLGAWDSSWQKKFEGLFDKLKLPADQRAQAMQGLASGGHDSAKLQSIYDEISQQLPADWKGKWEVRFKTLSLPGEMMKQLAESGAPEAALEKTYDTLVKAKVEFQKNGRYDKIQDAGATDEELWGMMIESKEDGLQIRKWDGEEFDKAVEAIHSQHVPPWKRVLSIGLNLIPGVGTLQYLTGKDWVTGEKIDRSNPLNIGMAVLSAIPAIGYAKGAFQAIRGAGMITGSIKAGTAATGLTQALEGAGLAGKFSQGLSAFDKIKMVTPIVNKFGEAGKLYQFSRGAYQGTQFLNAAGQATKLAADGSKVAAFTPDELRYMADNYVFRQKPSLWGNVLNPFRNNATVEATRVGAQGARYTDVLLGSAANVRSAAGIATIRGAANYAGLAAQASGGLRTTAALGASQADEIAKVATELGVANGSRFRSLLQLPRNIIAPNSEYTVGRALSEVNHTGRAWSAARSVGDWARNSWMGPAGVGMAVTTGVVSGQTGRALQPAWDYYRNRDGYEAQANEAERAAQQQIDAREARMREAQEQWEAQQQGAASQPGAPAPADPAAAGTTGGGAPGSRIVQDPQTGMLVDTQTGLYIDPNSGYYIDPSTGQYIDPMTGQYVQPTSGATSPVMSQPAGY